MANSFTHKGNPIFDNFYSKADFLIVTDLDSEQKTRIADAYLFSDFKSYFKPMNGDSSAYNDLLSGVKISRSPVLRESSSASEDSFRKSSSYKDPDNALYAKSETFLPVIPFRNAPPISQGFFIGSKDFSTDYYANSSPGSDMFELLEALGDIVRDSDGWDIYSGGSRNKTGKESYDAPYKPFKSGLGELNSGVLSFPVEYLPSSLTFDSNFYKNFGLVDFRAELDSRAELAKKSDLAIDSKILEFYNEYSKILGFYNEYIIYSSGIEDLGVYAIKFDTNTKELTEEFVPEGVSENSGSIIERKNFQVHEWGRNFVSGFDGDIVLDIVGPGGAGGAALNTAGAGGGSGGFCSLYCKLKTDKPLSSNLYLHLYIPCAQDDVTFNNSKEYSLISGNATLAKFSTSNQHTNYYDSVVKKGNYYEGIIYSSGRRYTALACTSGTAAFTDTPGQGGGVFIIQSPYIGMNYGSETWSDLTDQCYIKISSDTGSTLRWTYNDYDGRYINGVEVSSSDSSKPRSYIFTGNGSPAEASSYKSADTNIINSVEPGLTVISKGTSGTKWSHGTYGGFYVYNAFDGRAGGRPATSSSSTNENGGNYGENKFEAIASGASSESNFSVPGAFEAAVPIMGKPRYGYCSPENCGTGFTAYNSSKQSLYYTIRNGAGFAASGGGGVSPLGAQVRGSYYDYIIPDITRPTQVYVYLEPADRIGYGFGGAGLPFLYDVTSTTNSVRDRSGIKMSYRDNFLGKDVPTHISTGGNGAVIVHGQGVKQYNGRIKY